MSKRIAEQSRALSVFWLKKHGYLHKDYSHVSGGIKWTSYYGDESSIGFTVSKDDSNTTYERAYMELHYTQTDHWNDQKEDMKYQIQLTTTPCNYGGKRYWFTCPLTKAGQYCGRRVGVIYLIGKYYGCRHCGRIAYNSQMQGGRYKGFVSIPDIERAEEKVKRQYYNGKPTRKYRKVLKLNDKFEDSFIQLAGIKL